MVPEGWTKHRLDHHAQHITSGSRGWAEYYSDVGDVFVRITNLRRDSIEPDWTKTKHVLLPEGMNEGLRTRLKAGDILISITADLGIIGYIADEPVVPHYINQHVALVRLEKSQVDPEFIAYLLSSTVMRHAIQRLNDAGAKAGLSLPTIRSVPIITPPIAEQRKIADILSTWDRAIEKTESLLANARTQKRALMQSLLTGKRRFPAFADHPWKEVRLGDEAELITKGTTPTSVGFAFTTSGVNFIKAENVSDSGHILPAKTFISDECNEALKRSQFQAGDLLITIAGAIGRIGIVHDENLPANTNQAVAIVRVPFSSAITHRMLFYWLQGDYVQSIFRSSVTTGAQPNINLKQIGNLPLKVPSMAEQGMIVAALDAAGREVDALADNITKLRTEKKALMQQLLTGKRRVVVDA